MCYARTCLYPTHAASSRQPMPASRRETNRRNFAFRLDFPRNTRENKDMTNTAPALDRNASAANRARWAAPARIAAAPARVATSADYAPATATYMRELNREHARALWSTAPNMAAVAAAAVTPPPRGSKA